MNRSEFSQRLRDSIVLALERFRESHPAERPYAFAIVGGQTGNYIGYAIATEEGLSEVANRYFELGYRYEGFDWEMPDHFERLSVWLRWANPDDGWRYGDFEDFDAVQNALAKLFGENELADEDGSFEAFCTDEVLAVLASEARWSCDAYYHSIVVGFTFAEDPRDFLRSATRANPYSHVQKLWSESWHANYIDSRIKRPD